MTPRLALLAALAGLGLFGVGAAIAHTNHSTTTVVVCTPDPVTVGNSATCTATVTDNPAGSPDLSPHGNVAFSSSRAGTFSATSCVLVQIGDPTSECSVTYTPDDPRDHTITAAFTDVANGGHTWSNSNDTDTLDVDFITNIAPAVGARLETLDVVISGDFFDDDDSGTVGVTFSGTGITVNSVTTDSATQITVNITIAAGAATGARDVSVTISYPGPNATHVESGAFTVQNPVPTIASISPSSRLVGGTGITLTVDGTGFISGVSTVQYNGGARTTTFVSSTQLTATLPAADFASAGVFPVTVVNAAPGGGTSNAADFTVAASVAAFEIVEVGAAIGTKNLYLNRAGVGFEFDVLAAGDAARSFIETSFTGNVTVDLMDASDDSGALGADGCRSSWVAIAGTSQVINFSAADAGREDTANFTVADAYRKVHVRATDGTSTGCSSDAFVIRPSALTLSSTFNNTLTTGTPATTAGGDFDLTATAIAGYDGTPELDNALLQAHVGALAAGTVTGSFGAANPGTGAATGTTFTYSEVGAFRFATQGVFDDDFAAVDSAAGDCIAGSFSNALAGGQYGCNFRNTAATSYVGRFMPDHFDVTVTHGCTGGSTFTYSGQTFSVTVTARNAAGATTQNYRTTGAAYSKTHTLSVGGDTSNLTGNTLLATAFAAGVGTATGVTYTFPAKETLPLAIAIRAEDTDGRSSAGFTEESTEIRAGRISMTDSVGPETLDLPVTVQVETWQDEGSGADWTVEDEDTCTTWVNGDFTVSNDTAGTSVASNTDPVSGVGDVTLNAPGATGEADVTMTGADAWFLYDWDSDTVHDNDPSAHVYFGVWTGRARVIDSSERR